MGLKLNATNGGGSVELNVPNTVSSDITFTLPDSTGSANQVLKNSATPGTLEFGDVPPTPGQIIETLTGMCDGRQVTVGSGTYTMPTYTCGQTASTTYADLSGSNISYTPPAGTNQVIYDFVYHASFYATNAPLWHTRFYYDGTEVTLGRFSRYLHYDDNTHFRFIFSLNNSTPSIADGKLGTWNTAKEMKLQIRVYTSVFLAELHETHYFDGANAAQCVAPSLTITSIA